MQRSSFIYFLLAGLCLLVSITVIPFRRFNIPTIVQDFLSGSSRSKTLIADFQNLSHLRNISSLTMPRTPVYFLSHGGPSEYTQGHDVLPETLFWGTKWTA